MSITDVEVDSILKSCAPRPQCKEETICPTFILWKAVPTVIFGHFAYDSRDFYIQKGMTTSH